MELEIPRDPRLPERFWNKITLDANGCWIWNAAKRSGYGVMGRGRRGEGLVSAHRFAYEALVGEIPERMQLDHICRVRGCVNPGHLQPVNHRQNSENLSGAHRDSKSGVRGVWWDARRRQWCVQVCSSGRKFDGGRHRTLEEATRVAIGLRNSLHTNNLADRSS